VSLIVVTILYIELFYITVTSTQIQQHYTQPPPGHVGHVVDGFHCIYFGTYIQCI
jgi:hypothetical protein